MAGARELQTTEDLNDFQNGDHDINSFLWEEWRKGGILSQLIIADNEEIVLPKVFHRASFCFVNSLGTMNPRLSTFDLQFCRKILLVNSFVELHQLQSARNILLAEGPAENEEYITFDRRDIEYLNILAQCWLMLGDHERGFALLRLSKKLLPSFANNANWILMSSAGRPTVQYLIGGAAVATMGLIVAAILNGKFPWFRFWPSK